MTLSQNGKLGENFAAEWLQKSGYSIIGMNYHTRFGEIDIIAKDNETICFIEVKFRSNSSMGVPAEAVNSMKQERIIKTAMLYIEDMGLNLDTSIRFDIAEVAQKDGEYYIRYTENAFEWRNCE